ncbi:hypothetical protein BH20ACI4_BH20ACI4_32080 [soil metagenome]
MKLLLIFCSFFLFIQFSFAQVNDFYETVLSDFRGNSAFIALDIVSSEYSGRIIIENAHLYVLLNRAKGFDENAYQSFMKNLLQDKKKLCLCDADFTNIRFYKVKNLPIISEYENKGMNEFIKHFFIKIDEKYLMGLEKFSLDERSAVVSKLFEWKIATFIDDESGYLIIMDK